MFLKNFPIDPNLTVSEIVAKDYRTAEIFRRHGIGYCCGGKWPLDIACEMNGVDKEILRAELKAATRDVVLHNHLDAATWDLDFLIDYVLNIHHQYLKRSLPLTNELLSEFAVNHIKKFPYLVQLEKRFALLKNQLLSSCKMEEEVLFPYIRQVAHAHKNKESYAALLVKTLRKPVEDSMFKGHELVTTIIQSVRTITNSYTVPENACTSHKVVLARLMELDNDIMQHLYLEQSVLFPRALAIEKELLA